MRHTEIKKNEILINDEARAADIVTEAERQPFVVSEVTTKERKRNPVPPFITSKLQQEASRKLGFPVKRTMMIAQHLYEGVEIGAEGSVGLITYMRTDSTAIAGVAMGEARDVIRGRFGEPYTMPKGRVYKTKSKGAQEAHESIRPTSFRRDPDSLAGSLKPEELRGSTFTVTSAGKLGGLLTTPIVHHPEVAILSIGRVAERPVVRDGEIVARPTGYVSVTFDHRVVDGARAAEFGLAVIRRLEHG